MKLIDALEAIKQNPREGDPLRVALVCGFTPLHLKTFLEAHLVSRSRGRRIELDAPGLYGDLAGSLEKLATSGRHAVVVALEWPDLDPRLGWRHLGGWGEGERSDILGGLDARLGRLASAIRRIELPVAVAMPSAPLPPAAQTPLAQESAFELELRAKLLAFAAGLTKGTRTRVVSAERLDRVSPLGARHDLKAELASGFPYTTSHAAHLGALLAQLAFPAAPKKGLITDLDDTLWLGILGEIGTKEISWDLDHRSQMHGAYQQLLRSLAESGTLVGVASKNDASLVEQAFQREDLLLRREHLFPVEAHWDRKSGSVGRILKAWNIGADAVVFVDDSPLELAEVAAAHPGVECLLFPKASEAAIAQLLDDLRDRFGKAIISEEDKLRAKSLRDAPPVAAEGDTGDLVLENAEAEITMSFAKTDDARAFELVNKTNQFNLNGKRVAEGEWTAFLARPESFLLTVSYQDKYGPLGKIAVAMGRAERGRVAVDSWVMSCRAFSRRIEHRCLEVLFKRYDAAEIALDYAETARNGPTRQFLEEITGAPPAPGAKVTRATFDQRCPPLHHKIKELPDG